MMRFVLGFKKYNRNLLFIHLFFWLINITYTVIREMVIKKEIYLISLVGKLDVQFI